MAKKWDKYKVESSKWDKYAVTSEAAVDIPESSRIAYEHNNPGNLMYVGQEGATQGEPKEGGGYWAKFETPDSGFQGLKNDIQIKQSGRSASGLKPESTVAELINVYAPPTENNTTGYIDNITKALGVTPDTPIKDIDTDSIAREIAKIESGTKISQPDYDQKLQDKFYEEMAAKFGLIDSPTPVRDDVTVAKQDAISPYVNQNRFDAQAYHAAKTVEDEAIRQQKIIENAQKLGLSPEFLNQVVDFNKYFTPTQEETNKKEDYLLGSVQSFNSGVAELLRTADRGLQMVAESAGFEWKNPLFKDVAEAVDRVGAEGQYTVPDNIAGQIAGTMSAIAPDLIATFAMPEMKLAQMAKITKGAVSTIPKFPSLLAAKEGLRMYSQSGEGEKYNAFLKGAGKGFTEGLTYEALGLIGKEAAQLATALGAGKLASESTAGLASGTLFGTHALVADPEVWNNGDIDWEKGKEAFWTNFGVGMAFHAKNIGQEAINVAKINESATRKAHTAFWTSTRDLIRTGLASEKSQYDLRRESQKLWSDAMATKNPVERNQYLTAKTAVDNMIASRALAERIAQNPKDYIDAIKNQQDLNDKEKEFFVNRINETVEDYNQIKTKIENAEKQSEEELKTDQAKLDYLKSKGVEVADGTSMLELTRLYETEKQKQEGKLAETENIPKEKTEKVPISGQEGVVSQPETISQKEKSSQKEKPSAEGSEQKVQEKKFENEIEEKYNRNGKSLNRVEYVPIAEIDKFKEHDRETQPKFNKKELDDLTEQIKKDGGIKTPITLTIDKNGNALVTEGNTRLAAAKRLGLTKIPVKINNVDSFGSINKDKAQKLEYSSGESNFKVDKEYNMPVTSPMSYGFNSEKLTKQGGTKNDTENITGVSGKERVGEESKQAEPIKVTGKTKTETGGMVQTSQKETKDTVLSKVKKSLEEHGFLYHGTSNKKISDLILPPSKTKVISEKSRKKNLDKVFFSKSAKSANIYAGRAFNEYGGEKKTHRVIPIGDIDVLNAKKGTEVLMSDMAIVIPDNIKTIDEAIKYAESKLTPDVLKELNKKQDEKLNEQRNVRDDGNGRTVQEGEMQQQQVSAESLRGAEQKNENVIVSEEGKKISGETQKTVSPELKSEQRKKRISEINDELGDVWSDIADILNTKKSLTGEERKRLAPTIKKVASLYAEKYALKGKELIEEVKEFFKSKGISLDDNDIVPHVPKIEQFPVGTTNAQVKASREMRGLDAIPKEERVKNENLWENVVRKIDAGEINPRETVKEIVQYDNVEVSSQKEAIVKHDRWRILKEKKYTDAEIVEKQKSGNDDGLIELFQRKVSLENEMRENDIAAEKLGAEWGRTGQFRQRNIEEDMSFEAITREAKILNGGKDLSPSQEKKLQILSEKYKELQKKYDELKTKKEKTRSDFQKEQESKRKKAEQQLIDDIKNNITSKTKTAQSFDSQIKSDLKNKKLSQRENELKESLRNRLANLSNVKFVAGEGKNKDALKELEGVIKDMSELGVIKLEQGIDRILSKVKDYLSSINKNFNPESLDKYRDDLKKRLGIEKIQNEEYDRLIDDLVEKSEIGFDSSVKGILNDIAYNRVGVGRETIDEVVGDIYESVKDRIPNISERDIRDALSGYGEFRKLSKEETDVKVRELKRQGRLDSALEDVEMNKLPLRSGVERDQQTQETREKQAKLLKEIKDRELTPPPTEREQEEQWRNGLQAYQRRLENAIEDVKKEIATGEKKQRSKGKNYDDPKSESLKQELDNLRKLRDELFKIPSKTPEQKRIDSLNKQIDLLEEEIRTKKKRIRPESKKISSPEIKKLEEKRDELRKERNDLFKPIPKSEQQKREESITKATEKAIAKLEMDIENLKNGIPTDSRVTVLGKGKFGLAKPTDEKVTTQRIEELRKLKDGLQQQLSDLLPESIKDKALLDKYKKQRERRLNELLEQQRTKDYGEKPPTYRPPLDPKTIDINRQIERVKFEIEKEKEQIRLANRTLSEKLGDAVLNAWNLPKALLASVDLSAPFRQGLIMVSKPKAFGKAFNEMFKYAFSKKKYEDWLLDLRSKDEYYEMVNNGLYIAEPTAKLAAKEENFMSNWIKYVDEVPLYGAFRSGSERAYIGFLNKLRTDVYLNFKDKLVKQGFTGEELQNELKSYAHFVNTATGRGKLTTHLGKKEISFEQAAPVLNSVFFSPRLIASRLAAFNPMFYAKLSKEARKDAMKTYLGTAGIIMSTLLLTKLMFDDDDKYDLELDPRSSDFLKIKYGNTRFDLWGGHQQVARTLAQFMTGQVKTDGQIVKMEGDKFHGRTRLSVLTNFFNNKLSPSLAFTIDILGGGKNFEGEDITIKDATVGQTVPLYIQDLAEIKNEEGWAFVPIAGILALFGVGVQHYKTKKEDSTTRGTGLASPSRSTVSKGGGSGLARPSRPTSSGSRQGGLARPSKK